MKTVNQSVKRIATIHQRCGAALVFAFGFATAHAAIFTVGSPSGAGQPCTHGTIQSAIDAAENSAGADTVRLTRSLTYEPEANSIVTSQDLNIVGGFATCTQNATDNIQTVVSGGLGNGAAVFRITANDSAIVKLRHLNITLGQYEGIEFTGNGILQIIESTIDRNERGGIHAHDTGTDSELVIDTGTAIISNRNELGAGGVEIDGPIEMTMTAPQTIIGYNVGGLAGGLHVGPSSYAYIGSPGYSGLPAIYGNRGQRMALSAPAAGGIWALGVVKLFTTDPAHPVQVVDNSGNSGGGISLYGGTLCAWDFVIDDNRGGVGSGIHARGGAVVLNRNDYPGCTPHPEAVACAAGTACNSISGNLGRRNDGDPVTGAAIALGQAPFVGRGNLVGRRVQLRNNTGTHAILATDGSFSLDNCLVADNTVSGRLFDVDRRTETAGSVYLSDCTIANNRISGDSVMYARDELNLFNSIIDQPGKPAQAFGGNPASLRLAYLLLSDTQGMPVDPTIQQGNPLFVAPASGDYHLRLESPAIDFAPAITSVANDLDGNPRDIDLPGVPDEFGPRDLGAYEWASLLRNGTFDSPDLQPWVHFAGGWDDTQSVAGGSGSGSWKHASPDNVSRAVVGQQCIHLPGPGRYSLNGHGKGGFNQINLRDYAVLGWEFRRSGTAQCDTGNADAFGELTVGSGTSWGQAAQPAVIAVSPQDWTPTSSITVKLIGVDGGITFPASYTVWFDGITLGVTPWSDLIFSDGLELQ